MCLEYLLKPLLGKSVSLLKKERQGGCHLNPASLTMVSFSFGFFRLWGVYIVLQDFYTLTWVAHRFLT